LPYHGKYNLLMMNAFYERLTHFGELVTTASRNAQLDLAEHFTVQHPGFPVVSQTRSIMPKLSFDEDCPAEIRHKVRRLLKKSFNRTRRAG
jgi:hypothetical protein